MQTGGRDQMTAHDRPVSRWRWLASGAPLAPAFATMPWLHAQDRTVRWVAWWLGVIAGVTLLAASAIATRRVRR